MEKFVMASGIPVRYSDYGKGEEIICLLHGYLRSIEVWEHFGGLLGKKYRIIAIDLPGHGMSQWGDRDSITIDFMADVVSDVLHKAGVTKCCMIGHSMGGYVAAAMADLHPDQLNSVIFFHSSPGGDTTEKIELRKREIEIIKGGKKELLSLTNPGKSFAPQNLDKYQEQIDELSEQVMMMSDEAIVSTLNGLMERPDRTAIIASLKIPVMFIFGKFDQHIPVEAANAIGAQHPGAKVVWLENSGHTGFIEEPTRSCEIVTDFLTNTK